MARWKVVGPAALVFATVACVPVQSESFPEVMELQSLVLVDPLGRSVVAAKVGEPRAILTTASEDTEAWGYQASLEALGIRPGALVVDANAGCPLPIPYRRYRFDGASWVAQSGGTGLGPLVRPADLGISDAEGSLFFDLSCATDACAQPASYAGCRFDFQGGGCGISAFGGFLDRRSFRPTSILSDCETAAAPAPATLSARCQLISSGGPTAPCTVDVYHPGAPSSPTRSGDLHALVDSPSVDFGGLVDLGDRLLVSVVGSFPSRFACPADAPARLVALDRQTLATLTATVAPTCLKELSRDGDGFAALFLKPGHLEDWSFGRFDRQGRLLGSVDLRAGLFPPGPLIRLPDESFVFYGLERRNRTSTTRCAEDGSQAGFTEVFRVRPDFSVTSTVIGRVPGSAHDHLCGVSYTAVAALGPERIAVYEEVANRLEVIDFLPDGSVRLATVADTNQLNQAKLIDLVLLGSTLVAASGGDRSAISVEVESLAMDPPSTEATFVLGWRPHVEVLAKVDDRRAVAVLEPDDDLEPQADTRLQLFELGPRRRFIPDGLPLGHGELRSVVVDPSNGDVFGAMRAQGIVFRAPGFAQ